MPASYEAHRSQLELILQACGMAKATAVSTAEIMSWADLHGIDTHGISMIPPYDERRRAGRIDMRAEPVVVQQTPVSALIDGGSGLGHPNARLAMELAIDKAKTTGIGVAAVRNSAHFGACGFYALVAAEAGLIGMVTTSASGVQVAPTFGAQARLGTDPIAFAAPGRFRAAGDFRADVMSFCDTLRATKPVDPDRPVLVAGDPERRIAALRRQTGIPVGPNLLAKVREVALAAGAKWIMDSKEAAT